MTDIRFMKHCGHLLADQVFLEKTRCTKFTLRRFSSPFDESCVENDEEDGFKMNLERKERNVISNRKFKHNRHKCVDK